MFKKKYKSVVCADGFSMSVQASQTNYSDPRDDVGPYIAAEVGFPNRPEVLLMHYAEDPAEPTNTVYGWVPREVILTVIAKHGGLVEGELPNGITNLWSKS
jgi:hypothetical protein